MKKILCLLSVLTCLLLPVVPDLNAQSWDQSVYVGYRCGLLAIREVRITAEGVEFTADVANTGRLALEFPGSGGSGQVIVFTADASLASSGLSGEKERVAAAVLRSGLRLKPGQLLSGKRFRSGPTGRDAGPGVPAAPERLAEKEQDKDTSVTEVGCPDLVIDSLWIVRSKRYRIEFGWRMTNLGQAPAVLWASDGGGAGLGILLGSGTRITRASKPVAFISIKSSVAEKEGKLNPGVSMTGKGTILLDQRRLPSQRVLQVRLDPNGFVRECLETNNESTVPLPDSDQ